MLKYSVKLTENDFKDNNIVWREKYVAPDLSFISGVTDLSYHLEQYNSIAAESPTANQSCIFTLETNVVTRLGYVMAKYKEYPVKTVNGKDYVHINGRYFYANDDNNIIIKDWQCETFVQKDNTYIPTIIEKDVTVSSSNDKIELDTIYWIEDGYVNIDGDEYIFDGNEIQSNGTKGCLKYKNDGRIIDMPTKCSSIVFMPYTSPSLIHEVCKFKATSTPFMSYKYTSMKFCEYFFYAKYKEYYCPVRLSGSTFVCEVPINGDVANPSYYNVSGYSDDWAEIFPINTSTKGIKDINDLINFSLFITIDGDNFPIEYDYRISSNSKYIMVQMANQGITIPVGERITFVDVSNDNCMLDASDGTVFYNGKKYYAEEKIFDKAIINDTEYDVKYDEFDDGIAYVTIENEEVPMRHSGSTLTRYGYVIPSGSTVSAATEESYSISAYSGVNIDGQYYIIKDDVAYIDKNYKVKFIVTSIKGNSLYICTPYFNPNEYPDELDVNNKSFELCNEVIENQTNFDFQVENSVLGLQSITKETAFSYSDTPTSSDDVYDIFKHLKLGGNSGYVNIPISLSTTIGNNIIQSEIIKKDFCEKEKEKAINKIVDLEKDMYSPKIMINGYSGSDTDFQAIHTINVNLHFRTRNLDSWKVNEGYNDVSVSGLTDNWFITDYEPYKTMIASATSGQLDTLMEMSDLLGFLNFSNDDVFYQKSRLAKSFLRLSFYDSTDPQTQSLLATSSVFVNEHNLYKEFIDNSRKGVHNYIQFAEDIDDSVIVNKIRVSTERLGKADDSDVIGIDIPSGDTLSRVYVSLDENSRLSSRFVIDNKYSTDTSSEGFYIYMFREYAEKLHPKPIYMKVEFNHAGIGKTIPFIVPMKWSEKNSNNEVNPISALTLANSENVETLKEGLPLSWVYAQSYIPLYAVYDFKNKEYGYVFDKRYVKVDNNGVANINLFELKIKNDEGVNTNEGTAKIDINQAFREQ